jgi:50S ribosomal subunit-associated GTPase HflX
MTKPQAGRDTRRERAALVGLALGGRHLADPDAQLDELAGLVRAAGADVVLRVVQEGATPVAATLNGSA